MTTSGAEIKISLLVERPVVRNDRPSEVDVAIDVGTRRVGDEVKEKRAINLCVVIDKSGSMEGEPIERAKAACLDIYRSLNVQDRLTVLAFEAEVESVVTPQTPKAEVEHRIAQLHAGGGTNLAGGWRAGLLELQSYAGDSHIHRLLLLSDGHANVGEDKPRVLGVESARARNTLNILTSTVGIGWRFHEDILAALAQESGGRFWFIEEARIEEIIKEEFSGALSVLLERPRVLLELPEGIVLGEELNKVPKIDGKYRLRPLKANDSLALGVRLQVDPLNASDELNLSATLFDGEGKVQSAKANLRLASAEEYVTTEVDSRVTHVVERFRAAASEEEVAAAYGRRRMDSIHEMLANQRRSSWAAATTPPPPSVPPGFTRELHREVEDNVAMKDVATVLQIMLAFGDEQANELGAACRKVHMQRAARKSAQVASSEADNWATVEVLKDCVGHLERLGERHPGMGELAELSGKIREHLEKLS